jgi:hypothetical protein
MIRLTARLTAPLTAQLAAGAILVVTGLLSGCSGPPPDPLQLDGNLLTVRNQTSRDWFHVEIWLNTYYRQTADTIPPRGVYQAPLDTFVAGFGQRFNFQRMQVKDLRLTARTGDGKPFELKKEFLVSGLDVLKKKS